MSKLTFQKLTNEYKSDLFSWLEEPHIKEFWDNSQEHKDDILNFIDGRKEPSNYIDGRYVYWVGFYGDAPFCLIMTIKEFEEEDRPQIKQDYISATGNTYSMEFMIGNPKYFGKGLAAETLKEFVHYFKNKVDTEADIFFIDPDLNNPRAKHVYEKAGFEYVGDFTMQEGVYFTGQKTHFLVKKMETKLT